MRRESGNCVEVELFDANNRLVTGYIYSDSPTLVWVEIPEQESGMLVPLSQVGPWNSPYHRYHWV